MGLSLMGSFHGSGPNETSNDDLSVIKTSLLSGKERCRKVCHTVQPRSPDWLHPSHNIMHFSIEKKKNQLDFCFLKPGMQPEPV